MSILNEDERVLVVYRRMFESDQSRMFVGRVDAYQDGIVRLTGYTFARDTVDGNYCRKGQQQTKLFPLASGALISYVLPGDFAVEKAELEVGDLGLYLTDHHGNDLNISEWVHKT